jgi:hypothetical protein
MTPIFSFSCARAGVAATLNATASAASPNSCFIVSPPIDATAFQREAYSHVPVGRKRSRVPRDSFANSMQATRQLLET